MEEEAPEINPTVEGMDLDELKLYAEAKGIKSGNRGPEKAREYILKKLGELEL